MNRLNRHEFPVDADQDFSLSRQSRCHARHANAQSQPGGSALFKVAANARSGGCRITRAMDSRPMVKLLCLLLAAGLGIPGCEPTGMTTASKIASHSTAVTLRSGSPYLRNSPTPAIPWCRVYRDPKLRDRRSRSLMCRVSRASSSRTKMELVVIS